MNDSKNHIDKLTPELIEKYHNGTLSEEQQYQVERLMLNSSFDEEAMEGFESFEGDISADLEKLNSQLEKRIADEKKDAPFLWIKIAASIVILALSSYLVWDLVNDESVAPLAKNEAPESPVEESVSIDSVLANKSIADLNDSSLIAINKEKPESVKDDLSKPVISESQPLPRKSEVAKAAPTEIEKKQVEPIAEEAMAINDDELIDESEVLEEIILEEEVASELYSRAAMKEVNEEALNALGGKAAGVNINKKSAKRKADAAPEAMAVSEIAAPIELKNISGIVTSADGSEPLPGVNVVVKGTTVGTVTNIEGKYELKNLDSDETNTLVFSSIGLETEEIKVRNKEKVDVKMNEDVKQLSEVVVTRGATSNELNGIYRFAQPEIGITEYKKYLIENIQYPENIESKAGKVIVNFNVNEDGSLSNFVIRRSLGEWQDKEALRLIQDGPKWTPNMNGDVPETGQARVVVKFEDK